MFQNKIVAITGKLSRSKKEITEFIESEKGIVSSTITKKVTHIICADPNESSAKLKKAKELGIVILSENDLNVSNNNAPKKIIQTKLFTDSTAKEPQPKKLKTDTSSSSLSLSLPKMHNNSKSNISEAKHNNCIQEFDSFIKKMLESNSNLDKQTVFINFMKTASDDFADILKIIYHKQLKFGITSKNVLKFKDTKWSYKNDYVNMSLLDFVEQLVGGDISGHDALKVAVSFLHDYQEFQDTLLLIFDKDLKLRFGLSLVNKAIPNFVPVFNVSLGYAYDEKTRKHVETGNWYISKKLDGVRCISIIKIDTTNDNISIEFFSRGGLKFRSLLKVENELLKFIPTVLPILSQFKKENTISIVLDGEMCIIDKQGNEDFKAIVSQIKRKSVIVERPRYLIFDMLTLEEFEEEKSKRLFSDRLQIMKQLFPSYEIDIRKYQNNSTNSTNTINTINDNEMIKLLPQLPFTEEMFGIMSKKAEEQKWEGLMLRKDEPYSGKRSNDLLKVKQFETEEYTVEDVVFGELTIINSNTGLQETIETLVSVVITHKGINDISKVEDSKLINVGSGFSQDERKLFYENPDLIKGKVISVQYFQTTYSKDGKEGLRFPTFKGLYGSKRTI